MLRKIIIYFFIFFIFCPQSYAKDFKINYEEKLAYVNMDFWSKLGDEKLCGYISEAVKNNHDARKASYTVEEFNQKIKVTRSREFPFIAVAPAYLGAQVPKLDNFELSTNAFLLPFLVSYEADFLLKNHDKTKIEKKTYEIQKLNEKALYITMASDVATLYINIMKFDKMLELDEKILDNQKNLLKKAHLRYDNGIGTKTEINNAEKEIYTLESNMSEIRKNRRDALFELAVMIGVNPDCINNLQRSNLDDFARDYQPPSSISSDVIFSRPDVLAAEKELEKAKIDINVARKEFLPRFNITGYWIFNTIAPGNFFSWEASLASLLVGATQDIFTGGRKIANLKIKKLKYEQMFEDYKQTDLTALKEVNAIMCKIKDDNDIFTAIYKKNNSEKDNFRLVNLNFKEGTASQMDIYVSQIKLYSINQELLNRKAERFIDYITLYKAAGGNL